MSSLTARNIADDLIALRMATKASVIQQFNMEQMFNYPFSLEIWQSKYRYKDEKTPLDTFQRVAHAMVAHEPTELQSSLTSIYYHLMAAGMFMPAGRILAGAGTENRVTLVNCFVNETIHDSMEGIKRADTFTALTMQQGGGMGTDFSTIRPSGAILRRTGSVASGVLPFMDMWNATCSTIMSAGSRRGAMMGTLCDTHPDLINFIEAKQTAGRLTNFNVSILVSNALMAAVDEDEDWLLYFHEEPLIRPAEMTLHDFIDNEGTKQYAYEVINARKLWNLIMESTYAYAEPGIIFIDRVNELNNLKHIETIRCTNPCGEQPLPPHGACNLGALNLSAFVINPLQMHAEMDLTTLELATKYAQRFLDSVIDVTKYPLRQQAIEQVDKRRTGLGISGLADAFILVGKKYGNMISGHLASEWMRTVAKAAYTTSIELGVEKGSFGLYRRETYDSSFLNKLGLGALYEEKGAMRNGVILTIAPTGTTSIVFGNISASCEPNFAFTYERKVLQADNTLKAQEVQAYIIRLAEYLMRCEDDQTREEMEKIFLQAKTSAQELKVTDHILIQGKLQEYVDASISKTINCPPDMTFEDFKEVYQLAYLSGCKGCTTYRPSGIRGSILSVSSDEDEPNDMSTEATSSDQAFSIRQRDLEPRPQILSGSTYKITWPSWSASIYMTVNNDANGLPYEVFFTSKDTRHLEWMTALSLAVTSIFRLDVNPTFIADEFQQVVSTNDIAWIEGTHYSSIISRVGAILKQHFFNCGLLELSDEEHRSFVQSTLNMYGIDPEKKETHENIIKGEFCAQCSEPALVPSSGCKVCLSCGHSECG